MKIPAGPYPPQLITASVRCWGLSPPQLYGSLQVQLRWLEYDITELRINITNSSNGDVLKQTTIPYSDQEGNYYFNETLPGCVESSLNNFSILVGATVYSNAYGESAPSSAIEARMDTGKFAGP